MRNSYLRNLYYVLIIAFVLFIFLIIVMANQIGDCDTISTGIANIPEPSNISLYALAAPFLIWRIL